MSSSAHGAKPGGGPGGGPWKIGGTESRCSMMGADGGGCPEEDALWRSGLPLLREDSVSECLAVLLIVRIGPADAGTEELRSAPLSRDLSLGSSAEPEFVALEA